MEKAVGYLLDLAALLMLAFGNGWQTIWEAWLHLPSWQQEATKMVALLLIVLVTIMILGDIYRGEIQNRFFKIKLVAYPGANPSGARDTMWVPRYLANQPIDQIKSDASFYLYYRDVFGKERRKKLRTFDIKFKVRHARFQAKIAAELEHDHRRETLEDTDEAEADSAPRAEIVALEKNRAAEVARARKALLTTLEEQANDLRGSRLRRLLMFKRLGEIHDPKTFGIEVKFHFPINPFFILYKHPDRDLRSTAWLTVLTSVFALLMQVFFGYSDFWTIQSPPPAQ